MSELLEVLDCTNCGERFESLEKLFDGTDLLLGADTPHPGTRFGVTRCRKCGFVFTNPRVPESRIGEFYPASYGPHSQQAVLAPAVLEGIRPSRFSAARRYFLEHSLGAELAGAETATSPRVKLMAASLSHTRPFLANLLWFDGRGSRVLDVGCGAGSFLLQQRKLGWDTFGVEISANANDLHRKHGLKILGRTVFDVPESQEPFHAVTMNQVLEHVYDYKAALKQIAKVLRPRGLFYANIPAYDSFVSHAYRNYWYALDLPRHVNFFTPDTLKSVLAECGLKLRFWYSLSSTKNIERSEEYLKRPGSGTARTSLRRRLLRRNPRLAVRALDVLGQGDNLHFVAIKE